MRTLVTGASGGLGRILCETLSRAHADVVAVARQADASRNTVGCDLTDAAAVRRMLADVRPARVFHLAGSFSNDFETDYAVNAASTRYLLEGLAEGGLRARVVVLGSAAEYGLVRPEENPVGVDRVLRPVSVYGLTKAFQTQIAGYHAHSRDADVVVARMFNLFAPGLSERLFVGRVEKLIAAYRRGECSRIEVGNLDSERDYVDAPEAIRQLVAIADHGRRGGIYHVASGRARTMRSILEEMLDAAGVPREAVVAGQPQAGGRTGYDVPVIYADVSATRNLMAGEPS